MKLQSCMKYNPLKGWTLFEKMWLGIFSTITIYLFFAWHDSWLGLIASITGMLCVILEAKGKISNYYVGIVNILAYSWVSFQNKLYGETMLNMLYFLPMSFVGIYYWRKNKSKEGSKADIVINPLSYKEKIFWAIISVVGVFSYGYILRLLGANLPFVDAAAVALSILATMLMVRRATEQWIPWIMVNILSIYMWASRLSAGSTDISVLIMWIAFLVNAIYGYINWKRMETRDDTRKLSTT